VGFNLTRPDAAQICLRLGTTLAKVMAGVALGGAQIDLLLDICLQPVIASAAASVENFDQLSPARRFVVCDLTFNLGDAGWRDFTNTRACISTYRFNDAVAHLMQSDWYRQVGARAIRDVTMLRTGDWVQQ
jgi:hypothetical protein